MPLLRCRDCAVEVHADCYRTTAYNVTDICALDLCEPVLTNTAVLGLSWQCMQCAVGHRGFVCQLCPSLIDIPNSTNVGNITPTSTSSVLSHTNAANNSFAIPEALNKKCVLRNDSGSVVRVSFIMFFAREFGISVEVVETRTNVSTGDVTRWDLMKHTDCIRLDREINLGALCDGPAVMRDTLTHFAVATSTKAEETREYM